MSEAILSIDDLTIDLPAGADRPHAVENVSFDLNKGEILCVVGEIGLRQVDDRQCPDGSAARTA